MTKTIRHHSRKTEKKAFRANGNWGPIETVTETTKTKIRKGIRKTTVEKAVEKAVETAVKGSKFIDHDNIIVEEPYNYDLDLGPIENLDLPPPWAANAAFHPDQTVNTAPEYPTVDTAPEYPTVDTAPEYPTVDTAPEYPTVDTAPEYPTVDTLPPYFAADALPPYATADALPQYSAVDTLPPYSTIDTAPPYPTVDTLPPYSTVDTALSPPSSFSEAPREQQCSSGEANSSPLFGLGPLDQYPQDGFEVTTAEQSTDPDTYHPFPHHF
jgi:hypothetical protein